MKNKTCTFCQKQISGPHSKYATHVQWCSSNPDSKKHREKRAAGLRKTIDTKFGTLKTFTVNCFKCSTSINVIEREKLFPTKTKYYCSRQCANSRTWTELDKTKKSIAAQKNSSPKKEPIKRCKRCGWLKCLNAEYCGYGGSINFLIKYFGFDSAVVGTLKYYREIHKIILLLQREYFINKLSLSDIGKKYTGRHSSNIEKLFIKFKIKRRTSSDANTLNYIQGKFAFTNQYKSGYHISWDNKRFFLRSSYEFEYAQKLDSCKVLYEVEALRIQFFDSQQNKDRYAIPDFYLPATNTVVEIKSSWTYDATEMKDKFAAYERLGYNCKLILDKKEVKIIC